MVHFFSYFIIQLFLNLFLKARNQFISKRLSHGDSHGHSDKSSYIVHTLIGASVMGGLLGVSLINNYLILI